MIVLPKPRVLGTTYELPDRLGSAWRQSTATSSGSVSNRNYDAFGLTLSTMGSPVGPFGHAATSGYQEDADSGLKLLGHRYYDASTGRFLSRDPAQDGRNWYGYCGGNPLGRVDPSGLSFWGWGDDRWVEFSRWFNGRDDEDNNGNPVHIGGLPSLLNKNGNAMTYDGTVHVDGEETFQKYMNTPHWQNHEGGHIEQGFSKLDIPLYAVAQIVGFVHELITMDGDPSTGGGTGHDYNWYEEDAEEHARSKDGKWEFGSPP